MRSRSGALRTRRGRIEWTHPRQSRSCWTRSRKRQTHSIRLSLPPYRLAGATGGLAITPLTGTVAFVQLKKQLSASYILAIETEPSDRDGKSHRIFRRIGAESARYNLGDFRRTLNLPTVTLSFMRRAYQERFTFTRVADEKVAGRVSRVLRFKERTRPTLVATANGVDIPVEGRIWMDAEDGRVVRTEIRFDRGLDLVERRARANLTTGATDYVTESVQNGEQRSSIQVEFRSLPDLGILVPVQMWEWHEGVNQPGRMPTDKSALQSLSAYSNFRRFQVSTTEQIKQ